MKNITRIFLGFVITVGVFSALKINGYADGNDRLYQVSSWEQNGDVIKYTSKVDTGSSVLGDKMYIIGDYDQLSVGGFLKSVIAQFYSTDGDIDWGISAEILDRPVIAYRFAALDDQGLETANRVYEYYVYYRVYYINTAGGIQSLYISLFSTVGGVTKKANDQNIRVVFYHVSNGIFHFAPNNNGIEVKPGDGSNDTTEFVVKKGMAFSQTSTSPYNIIQDVFTVTSSDDISQEITAEHTGFQGLAGSNYKSTGFFCKAPSKLLGDACEESIHQDNLTTPLFKYFKFDRLERTDVGTIPLNITFKATELGLNQDITSTENLMPGNNTDYILLDGNQYKYIGEAVKSFTEDVRTRISENTSYYKMVWTQTQCYPLWYYLIINIDTLINYQSAIDSILQLTDKADTEYQAIWYVLGSLVNGGVSPTSNNLFYAVYGTGVRLTFEIDYANKKVYKVTGDGGRTENLFEGSLNDYADYEYLQYLSAYIYTNLWNSMGQPEGAKFVNLLLESDKNGGTVKDLKPISDAVDHKKYISETSDLETEANRLVDDYQSHTFLAVQNPAFNTARLAYTLAIYLENLTNYSAEANGYITWEKYDAGLQDMAAYSWDLNELNFNELKVSQAILPMPYAGDQIRNLQCILGSDNKDVLSAEYIHLFYGITYAFEAMNTPGTGMSYTYDDLYEVLNGSYHLDSEDTSPTSKSLANLVNWIKSCSDESQYSSEEKLRQFISSDDEICLYAFRSIIELHDLCEVFGIPEEAWSKSVQSYLKLYDLFRNTFNALRENTAIYGLAYQGELTLTNPLGLFFSTDMSTMSNQWDIGFALSALYTPMITNMYDASTYTYVESDWVADYAFRYGFYRKALYISIDPNVITNNFVGKTVTQGTKVATLADLLNYDRDIELYVDTGFYNADAIEEAIGKVDYATLYQYLYQEQAKQLNVTDTAAMEGTSTIQNGEDNISNKQSDGSSDQTTVQKDTGLQGAISAQTDTHFIDDTVNLNTDSLLKTRTISSYSINIANSIQRIGAEKNENNTSIYNSYILSAEQIVGEQSLLDLYTYSPMVSYCVVSAIYRDPELFNAAQSAAARPITVFRSSKGILKCESANHKAWMSYMNYLMLANLDRQMQQNVDTKLDLDAPIFIDIFGNILTESGYVIIPAAANVTLCGDNWTPYTVGFGTLLQRTEYNIAADLNQKQIAFFAGENGGRYADEYITTDEEGKRSFDVVAWDRDHSLLEFADQGGWFYYNERGDKSIYLRDVMLSSGNQQMIVQWSTLNTNAEVLKDILYSDAYFNKAKHMYSSNTVGLVLEVLRGAPIENIDYVKEELTSSREGTAGVVVAYALDNILDVFCKGDQQALSMVSMPNVAFENKLDYIIYFGVKIALAILLAVFVFRLFLDGIRNHLGLRPILSYAFSIIVVASAIWLLPNIIKLSYNKANSMVLKSESADILMYDALRKDQGQELGITDVHKISENTKLLVEIGNASPKWGVILAKSLLTNEYKSFREIFDEQLKTTIYYGVPGIEQDGSTVYLDVQSVLDSTKISYSNNTGMLSNRLVYPGSRRIVNGDVIMEDYFDDSYAIFSFTSPYYVMLDQLVENINSYNYRKGIKSMVQTVDGYGNLSPSDISYAYFMSEEFMEEGYDILGMYNVCQSEVYHTTYVDDVFTDEDIRKMQQSEWYPNNVSQDIMQKKIERTYNKVRTFVSEHSEVLKHVSDEVFIKTVALVGAVEFNSQFNAPYASNIVLNKIDNRDLLRFMMGNFDDVYKNYSYTFGRYAYETSGTVGVVLAIIFVIITALASLLKLVLVVALFVIVMINVCFRKLLFGRENQAVEGYFIGCSLFIGVNLMYAVLLKMCFLIANYSVNKILAIFICIIVQVLYSIALILLIRTQVKDWKNSGAGLYGAITGFVTSKTAELNRNLTAAGIGAVAAMAGPYAGLAQTAMNMGMQGGQMNMSSSNINSQQTYLEMDELPEMTRDSRRRRRNRVSVDMDSMLERDAERERSINN